MNFTCLPKTWSKIVIALSFTCIFSAPILAQQCGFEGTNVFALNVHLSNKSELIKGLKIYLVNENNEPYLTETRIYDKSKKKYGTRYDTLFFWDNLKAKKHKNTNDKYRKYYLQGAGESYVILIPESQNYFERGTFSPVYRARIVDIDGTKNGGYFTTRVVRLDYAQSANVCNSGILDYPPSQRPNPTRIKSINGGSFVPMDINLSYLSPLIADTGIVKHMYRTKRDTLRNIKGEDSLFAIREIEIKNYRTLIPVQKIVFPEKFWCGNVLIENLPEYYDFYNNNPRDVKDFRILVENKKGDDNRFHKRYLNYVYSENSNRYESDTLLDRYWDVEINTLKKTLTRAVYKKDTLGEIKITYRLFKHGWDIESIEKPTIPKKELPIPRKPELINPSKYCLRWLDMPPQTIRIIEAKANYYETVRDSFRFINSCDHTIYPAEIILIKDLGITMSKSVKPNDTGYVYYKEHVSISPNGITFHERYFKPDEQNLFRLRYFIAGNATQRRNLENDGLEYSAYLPQDSSFKEVLTLDFYRRPRSLGLKAQNDTTHYGNWRFWNEEGKEHYKTFSKKLVCEVQTFESLDKERVSFKAKKNGTWINLSSWPYLSANEVYVSEDMDSLQAFNSKGSNKFKINYKNFGNDNYLNFYLLKKNQYSLSLNGSSFPIELVPNVYRIQPDWVSLQKISNGLYSQDFFIDYFKKKFPDLKQVLHGEFENELLIDLNEMPASERKNTLKQLIKEETIQSIGQLITVPGNRTTFCDRNGQFAMNYNLPYDSVRKIIIGMDMQYHGTINGTGNHHQFTYNHKLIDRSFFDLYNNACKHPDVISGSLNFYFRATLDHQKD
jgi:hypothetical protein